MASNFRQGFGVGLATITDDGTVLDTWYPAPSLILQEPDRQATTLLPFVGRDDIREVSQTVVETTIDLDAAPESTADAYLRLHLLSHLLVKPNTINLEGIFAHLPNVVWTTNGPVAPDTFKRLRPALQRAGIQAASLDKFPRMLDYVLPDRVRIADASRVRLGAHLAPGTTVMHEGFVNFNAGTLGESMVEGRISQGVVVGSGSDIGGGASIMGTLSGGGTQRIVIGERALLGANSGVGISIGNDSVVEAGLYVTAGTKVTLVGDFSQIGIAGASIGGAHPMQAPDGTATPPQVVKAVALSGAANVLFRRNSTTGQVEAVARTAKGITLNSALHA